MEKVKVQGTGMGAIATIMDAQPTAELVAIYDMADRMAEVWKARAAQVQMCHDAGMGGWRELRQMAQEKPADLETLVMSAVFVLARRQRQQEALAKVTARFKTTYRRPEIEDLVAVAATASEESRQ